MANPKIIMTVEGLGPIEMELFPEIAPISVANFIKLSKDGFYTGTGFHRVVPDFVIQGGDPTGTGSGGPGHNIKGEFQANGVVNNLKHKRGVLSMARSQAFDSAGSQFFIMHADAPHLDGSYAGFGQVTSGMEVVDAVVEAYFNGKTSKIQSVEVID